MSTPSYLTHVLKDKLPDASEIELHLFELCNLRCHFCGQDHDDIEGMTKIVEKSLPVMDFIEKNLNKNHIVNVMGGEIFSDELEDHLFEDYFNLAKKIDDHARLIGHNVIFNWVTNLIFTKQQRVTDFLKRLHDHDITANISTSYDFKGRKNSLWSLDKFKENLELYKNNIYTVGFVMTKPTIDFLLTQHDPFFEYLYENYPLYFDYYVPENGAKVLMPSDQDILNVFRYIAIHYPKISPVKDLLENTANKMTCYSLNKLTLLPDGEEVKCRYLDYKADDFNQPVDYLSNENIIEAHLEKNQCLSCKWFERCTFRCFVQADWSKRESTAECLYKTFFNETIRISP